MEHKLIEAVQMFPCLYDKSLKEYRNKLKKEKSWASVATAAGATVEQCQSRWRSLRDRYVRETVSAKAKSGAAAEEKHRWCYIEAMSFLQKHVAPRSTFSNMQWSSSDQESCLEAEETDVFDESSCSLNTSSYFVECTNNASTEEKTAESKSKSIKTRRKIQEQAHEKFDALCGAVSDLIAAKKESGEKNRNADFLKVLDSYLLKHSEDEQDRLKIEILSMVYNKN